MQSSNSSKLPVVYFTREISPDALMRIYRTLARPATGNNVAVKVTTGEPGGHNFLKPDFMKELIQELNGTIIEWNLVRGLMHWFMQKTLAWEASGMSW